MADVERHDFFPTCLYRFKHDFEENELNSLIKHIEDFAWLNKCDLLELVARPGWKKVLKPFGYTESHVLLEKKKEK